MVPEIVAVSFYMYKMALHLVGFEWSCEKGEVCVKVKLSKVSQSKVIPCVYNKSQIHYK